jgi:conjugative relaxase-like TrwC/TraI family protein
MLTPKPQLNLKNAKGYFREHLAVGDYYMDGHAVAGEWHGTGATLLGLEGKVTEDTFLAMCEGQHPKTGQRLTMRQNTTRREGTCNVSNRRIFYDFTISPPKSVSLVALYQDARIIEVHDRAARVMMDELEKFAETRVRKDGANSERVTGTCVSAMFRHDTSRELDPHLHTHCIVLNATFDWDEQRWKALHATGMYRAQKFAENVYYHELAKGLKHLGYSLENNARDFEISGVPSSAIALFSKRHRQIDEETKKRVEAEGLRGNEKELRKQIAHDKRRRKIKHAPVDALRPRWTAEMNDTERAALDGIKPDKLPPLLPSSVAPDIAGMVAWADAHVFERKAVTTDYELMACALAHGRGENFSVDEVADAVARADYVRDATSRKLTSQPVRDCEWDIVCATLEGRNSYAPFVGNIATSGNLSADQRHAVEEILRSQDFITLFQGGAGTGKSFTLREVVRALDNTGCPVVVVAPQNQQVADLQRDGLSAQSLARVIACGVLVRGSVVIVDEAGQIGGKDMLAIIRLTQSVGGRLILSGDTRQQGAVSASDALRVIEKHGDLFPVRLETIRRQNPSLGKNNTERAAIKQYRTAVEVAAAGQTKASFDKLRALGWVREYDTDTLHQKIAQEYCAALERKEQVLAIAQTWDEVRAVNAAIRTQLRESGKLGAGVAVSSWQSRDLSEAQKRDVRFYEKGTGVYFVRSYGRYQRGDYCTIDSADEKGVTLLKDGRRSRIGYDHAGAFAVTQTRTLELARGDRLQMKFNGKSAEGKPIRNGELVTVRRILKDGRIGVVDDSGERKTLSPSQRMFVPGYAVTSYASQGKTVDTVLVAYSGDWIAANKNQWYVGISRARKQALVFTDDTEALATSIEHESNRELALSINPQPSVSSSQTVSVANYNEDEEIAAYMQQRAAMEVQLQAQQSQQAHLAPPSITPPIQPPPQRGISL